MKKVLLTLTAVAGLTLASKAQDITGFQKGNFIVEGNLGYNTTDNKTAEIKESLFNFSPKAGYFVTDKIAVGAALNFANGSVDKYGTLNTKTSSNEFGAAVFGRYYFLELGSRFKTYAEVDVDFSTGKSKVTTAGTTVDAPKVNGFGINGAVGANYFLTDKIAINFAFANIIGYNSDKVDVKDAKSTSSFGVNVNSFDNFFNAAQFGLTFKF